MHLVQTQDMVVLFPWFAESALGTPAFMLFYLCSVCVVYAAHHFCWKLIFVFTTSLFLVSQLASLHLFLELPKSLIDILSASPPLHTISFSTTCVTNIAKFVSLEIKCCFATSLLLVSQLQRLHLVPQLSRLLFVLLLLVSAAPPIVSAILMMMMMVLLLMIFFFALQLLFINHFLPRKSFTNLSPKSVVLHAVLAPKCEGTCWVLPFLCYHEKRIA